MPRFQVVLVLDGESATVEKAANEAYAVIDGMTGVSIAGAMAKEDVAGTQTWVTWKDWSAPSEWGFSVNAPAG